MLVPDDKDQSTTAAKPVTLEYLLWRDAGMIRAQAELARSALLVAQAAKTAKQRQGSLETALDAMDHIIALAMR